VANSNFSQAKNAKNDEFYTQWRDIEQEIQAYLDYNPDVFRGKTVLCPCDDPYESNFFKYFALNFNGLGLKKLIATCYAGSPIANTQLSLFDHESEENKTTKMPHKIIINEAISENKDRGVDLQDIVASLAKNEKNTLTRLDGDGDFRSDEVKKLRDEADYIITNPPFSLFREFLAWVIDVEKQFLIIGNKNAITYREVFPLIKENKIWTGSTSFNKDILFMSVENILPDDKPKTATRTVDGVTYLRSPSIWFTNIDHGRRHQPLSLMTMKDNLKHSKHKEIRGKEAYDYYDNYDAIEVPFTSAIPSDYDGVMGVPISFLDKYCPEQFEIVDCNDIRKKHMRIKNYGIIKDKDGAINGKPTYARLCIRKKGVAK